MQLDEMVIKNVHQNAKALAIALGHRDLFTWLHSDRVRGIAVDLGRQCDLSASEITAIAVGATFHDIGKIGVPDSVLLKPTKLDQDDWSKMKKHPAIGEEIVLALGLLNRNMVASLIRHHHEHFNGNGYPDRLAGNDIPVGARIISVADSYDAMSETRAYHPKRTHAQVMDVIESETGSKLDPMIVGCFSMLIEKSEYRVA